MMEYPDGFAYFVRSPKRVQDLMIPHPPEKEWPYEVVASVFLSAIEFENFTQDMTVERAFLEKHRMPCSIGPVWRCVYVGQKKGEGAVLVMPKIGGFVDWAAYVKP